MLGFCGAYYFKDLSHSSFQELDLMSLAFQDRSFENRYQNKNFYWRVFDGEHDKTSAEYTEDKESDKGKINAAVFGSMAMSGVEVSGHSFSEVKNFVENNFVKNKFDALAKINGNWVIALRNEDSLILSRDPVGIQTLYYIKTDRAVYFSTHLSAFECLPCNKKINFKSLARFLHFFYIPCPETIYEDIKCVPVGQAVEINSKEIKFHQFANTRFGQRSSIADKEKTSEIIKEQLPKFEELLVETVRLRTAQSGRTAIFLSGGKDSSALAIAAAKIDPKKYLAVTVGFEDSAVDETDDARLVAEHFGLEHLVLKFSAEDYASSVEEYIKIQGQPHAEIAGLPLFLAAKKLPPDVGVILDGTGNDYYMGIPASLRYNIYLKFPVVRFFVKLLPKFLINFLPAKASRGVNFFRKPFREIFLYWNGWSEEEIKNIFGWDGEFENTELAKLVKSRPDWDSTDLKTEAICKIWEPDNAYRKVVAAGNFYGITVRFPFADISLSDFFKTLPSELCYRGMLNKVLLREFMARYLPKEILEKPKGSFVFNPHILLSADDYQLTKKYLNYEKLKYLKIKDIDTCLHLIKKYIDGEEKLADKVWPLFFLSVWVGNKK